MVSHWLFGHLGPKPAKEDKPGEETFALRFLFACSVIVFVWLAFTIHPNAAVNRWSKGNAQYYCLSLFVLLTHARHVVEHTTHQWDVRKCVKRTVLPLWVLTIGVCTFFSWVLFADVLVASARLSCTEPCCAAALDIRFKHFERCLVERSSTAVASKLMPRVWGPTFENRAWKITTRTVSSMALSDAFSANHGLALNEVLLPIWQALYSPATTPWPLIGPGPTVVEFDNDFGSR